VATQLARGLWANFGPNPRWVSPNGMEANLRFLDDHAGLYTLAPPVVASTPLPSSPANGDGQIYTNGSYAVYNSGQWTIYPSRRGMQAALLDGSALWVNGGGHWVLLAGDPDGTGAGYHFDLVTGDTTRTEVAGTVYLLCDATDGDVTVTLPDADANEARFTVKKTDPTAHTVTVAAPSGQTIDGDATLVIAFQHTTVEIFAGDTNWWRA
jgi:hypothetical protein